MKLSVIIVNYNAGDYILRCLESLRRIPSSISWEAVVVDNDSTDQSIPQIRFRYPSVKVIQNTENRGFSKALNQGIREAKGEWILWLNPDAEILDSDWTVLFHYLDENHDIGIAGLKILNPDGSLQLSCRSFPDFSTALFNRYSLLTKLFPKNPWTRRYLKTDFDHNSLRQTDWVSGAALLHRRKIWQDLGGLDENFFMYSEDVDFCRRALFQGWKTIYYPGLKVTHRIGESSRQNFWKTLQERHRSIWIYYKKHFKRNILKDIAVLAGITVRFLMLSAVSLLKPMKSEPSS